MKPEAVSCFNVLDDYARLTHSCFLAEFFPKGKGSYLCCFRPEGGEIDSTNQYACKYVTVSADQIERILSSQCISGGSSEDTRRAIVSVDELIKFAG